MISPARKTIWSDPRGEFLGRWAPIRSTGCWATDGLGAAEWPAVHAPVHSTLAYHLRAGSHGVNDWDWEQFMDWADGRVVERRHVQTFEGLNVGASGRPRGVTTG